MIRFIILGGLACALAAYEAGAIDLAVSDLHPGDTVLYFDSEDNPAS